LLIDELLNSVDSQKGKSWPKKYVYKINNNEPYVEVVLHDKKEDLREFEVWSIAFYDLVKKEISANEQFKSITLSIKNNNKRSCDIEALRRRLSYLCINNNILIKLIIEGINVPLYSHVSLLQRPKEEILREDYKDRNDEDKGERLEKDFQAFLFGKGMKTKTNDRLAIFGDDFRGVKKKGLFIIREFPTGVFLREKKEKTRVLPTNFIDLVTLNKRRQLSLIELKLDDAKLEVIPQTLDYTLFAICYFKQFKNQIINREKVAIKTPFISYLVSNAFHEKFNSVMTYYLPKIEWGFNMKVCELGYYRDEIIKKMNTTD
jgi:hypothetical protein